MKKIYVLACLGFLTACNGIIGAVASGKTQVTCVDVLNEVASDATQTTVTIQGEGDKIVSWTRNTTVPRAEFDSNFLQDTHLTDSEIQELFEIYSQGEVAGIEVRISEINHEFVVISRIYDYSQIEPAKLNQIWAVKEFSEEITLNDAISGLQDQGAVCETKALADEEAEVE